MKNENGFSLIETLIVISFIGAISLWSWVSLGSEKQNKDRSAMLSLVMQIMERARWTAIASGHETWVVVKKSVASEGEALMIYQISDDEEKELNGKQMTPWYPIKSHLTLSLASSSFLSLPEEFACSFSLFFSEENEIEAICFSPRGGIQWPDGQKVEWILQPRWSHQKTLDWKEKISIQRFSGRIVYEE